MVDKVKLAAMVREIGEVAPRVGKEYVEQQAAFRAQHLAEVKLLTSLVKMSKSGLPAISRNIPSSDTDGVLLIETKEPLTERPNRLYLRDDGTFWQTWDYFDNDVQEWCESGRALPIDSVVQDFDINPMISVLHTMLTKQAGKRKPSTEEARDTANKISAVLTLLDAPPQASLPPGFDDALGDEIPF